MINAANHTMRIPGFAPAYSGFWYEQACWPVPPLRKSTIILRQLCRTWPFPSTRSAARKGGRCFARFAGDAVRFDLCLPDRGRRCGFGIQAGRRSRALPSLPPTDIFWATDMAAFAVPSGTFGRSRWSRKYLLLKKSNTACVGSRHK